MKFDTYHISSAIKRNLSGLGFKRPTDIQYKAIPSIMKGEDVLAIAQTGTGKTAAFAIPIIDKIHRAKSSKRSWGIKCIVLVPTRELAAQIGSVFNDFSKHTKVKTVTVYGGVEQDPQIKKLADGIDVLVATPGRMFDLISQGAINLQRVDTLVLDEADQMLDLGFIDDIKSIKRKLVKNLLPSEFKFPRKIRFLKMYLILSCLLKWMTNAFFYEDSSKIIQTHGSLFLSEPGSGRNG